jgi:hypothetical protein
MKSGTAGIVLDLKDLTLAGRAAINFLCAVKKTASRLRIAQYSVRE